MYSHILQKHAGQGRWLFIHYDQVFDRHVLKKIAAMIDVEVDSSFPEKQLNRSTPGFPVDDKARGLYRRLCELADYKPRE